MCKRLKRAFLAALALWLLVATLSYAQGSAQKLNLEIEGMV